MSGHKVYENPVYELLESLRAYHGIPRRLKVWIAECEREKLIAKEFKAYDITDLGLTALLARPQAQAAVAPVRDAKLTLDLKQAKVPVGF
jgi:hypothetical protein